MEFWILQDLFEWFVGKVWDKYGPVIGILAAVASIAAIFALAYLIVRLFL